MIFKIFKWNWPQVYIYTQTFRTCNNCGVVLMSLCKQLTLHKSSQLYNYNSDTRPFLLITLLISKCFLWKPILCYWVIQWAAFFQYADDADISCVDLWSGKWNDLCAHILFSHRTFHSIWLYIVTLNLKFLTWKGWMN